MKLKAKKSRSLTFNKGKERQQKFIAAGEQMPAVKVGAVARRKPKWHGDHETG